MRSRFLPLLAVLTGAATAQCGGFTAQWTALSPIVAEWVNAPVTAPNPIVTYPAGPLPAAPIDVAVDVGLGWWTGSASFSSTPLPLQSGMVAHWSLSAYAYVPQGEVSRTTADLLLRIDGPDCALGTLELQLTMFGDSPQTSGFRVDIGNDGSFELDTFTANPLTSTLDRNAFFAWDFAGGPLFVRVTHTAYGAPMPQDFGCRVAFRPWVAGVDTYGDDCGNETVPPLSSGYTTRYHLAVLPPFRPQDSMVLRANGIGPFAAFLLSDRIATVTFQLTGSPSPACDLLSHVVFTHLGGVASVNSGTIPVQWIALVPPLPPGLDLNVQHASLLPPHFGLTNRVRIRT
ncbi:MAG: hypothetical protein U1E73_08010 [Planctomycetota bacterium]